MRDTGKMVDILVFTGDVHSGTCDGVVGPGTGFKRASTVNIFLLVPGECGRPGTRTEPGLPKKKNKKRSYCRNESCALIIYT